MKRLALVLALAAGWPAPPAFAQLPLYVANGGDSTTKKIPPGGGSFTTAATGIDFPVGIVVTANGTQYVSDYTTNSILKVTPAGVMSTFASGFGSPTGLALDSAGSLYVADRDNGQIVRVAPNGTKTVWTTGLVNPYGLALDRTGANLYISDFDNQAVYKAPNSQGATAAPVASVTFPTGLAVGLDGTVYVGSSPAAPGTIRTLPAGGGPQGTYASGIMSPRGLAFDPAGNLFVSAWGSGDVFRIPVGGGTPTVYATGFSSPYFVAFPVPEPVGVLLACGGAAAAAAAWRRLRRPRRSPIG